MLTGLEPRYNCYERRWLGSARCEPQYPQLQGRFRQARHCIQHCLLWWIVSDEELPIGPVEKLVLMSRSAGGTYLASGCPTGYCQGFVAGNPKAFEETYWSINNLRVYTANGQIAGMVGSGSPLSAGAIAGIAVGGVVVLAIIGFLLWRHRRKTVTR